MTLLWLLLPVIQRFGIVGGLPQGGAATSMGTGRDGAIPIAMMTEPSPPSTAFYNAMVDRRRTTKGKGQLSVILESYLNNEAGAFKA